MTALYNEIDKNAAAWLRQLIIAGHIAPGVVDERDIRDLEPDYVATFTQFHAFAGIGVWSHALRRGSWSDERPVWTGSCPCQPFSAAGKGGGFDDERHLWPAFHHLIAQCRPDVVLGEQVASKDGLNWLDLVHADLEGEGYAVGAVDTCAAGFGAPHIRQRLYWSALADADGGLARHTGSLQSSGQYGQQPQDGGASDGLADAQGDGHERCGQLDQSTGRDGATHGGTDSVVRLNRSDADPAHPVATLQPAADGPDGVDDDNSDRAGRAQSSLPIGQQGADGGLIRPGPTNGFWGAPDWLHCRDGRWRPVEPGTFPLAHGAPARVGRLRGYGNAIVAPQAQAFVECVLEAVQ